MQSPKNMRNSHVYVCKIAYNNVHRNSCLIGISQTVKVLITRAKHCVYMWEVEITLWWWSYIDPVMAILLLVWAPRWLFRTIPDRHCFVFTVHFVMVPLNFTLSTIFTTCFFNISLIYIAYTIFMLFKQMILFLKLVVSKCTKMEIWWSINNYIQQLF